MQRDILHINVTAFPIGVERAREPALRDRPVVMAAAHSPRAVALCVSREAYLEGVTKGMPVTRAVKICPGLRVIPPDEPLYRRAAAALLKAAGDYSPLVEPWRAGHLYLDLTGSRRLWGAPMDAAARIQREIRDRFSLRNTVGVAANKLVSRVASRLARPRGVCDVFAGFEAGFLAPHPVDLLPGVGPATLDTLIELNLRRVGELAALSPRHLQLALGTSGIKLHALARGIDDSPVRPPERKPCVHVEETLPEDANDDAVILALLRRMVEQAGRKLRALGLRAGRIKIEIIHTDHDTVVRQNKLPTPADLDAPIFEHAARLLEMAWTRRVRLRHVSLWLMDLSKGPTQLGLFDHDDQPRRLQQALDQIRDRFGENAVRFARGTPALLRPYD